MHQPMHQSLSDESLLMSATQALNPLLKRALGVLDARLEDELARYRRYRAGKRVAPSAVSVMARGAKMTPGMKAAPQKLSLDLLQTVSAPPKPITPVTPEAPAAAIAPQANPAPPPPPRTPLSIQNQPIQNQPIQNESALVLTTDDGDTTIGQDTEGNNIGIGSQEMLLSLEDFAAQNDYQGSDFGNFAADEAPNQYMESSEALLRSLAEEEATAAAERNVLEGLLTPMGVGSMLLMLLGSGMFGYLIMNPSSLTALQGLASKIANFRRPTAATAVATNGGVVDVDGADGGNVAWMSNAPALDSGEFLNLNLNNFSALRTRPGGSGLSGLTLLPTGKPGQSPLAQLGKGNNAAKKTAANKGKPGITGLTPLNIQPIVPPAPAIAGGAPSGGLFAGAPVRVSTGGGGGGGGNPAPIYQPSSPRIEPVYEAPRRAPRSYEPAYQAPARSYEAPPARNYEPPAYTPPPATVPQLPPPPVEAAPAAVEPQGEYRVVTPYTSDADLEAAQKSDSSASFRNLDDGAYVQRGGSYSNKAEADAAAAKLQEQGVQAEVK
jgi:hypothetical protein